MEFVYVVLLIVAVLYFGSTIKRTVVLVDKAVDGTINIADTAIELGIDTTHTYKHEVLLSNNEKRRELMNKYQAIDTIVSIQDLDEMAKASKSSS